MGSSEKKNSVIEQFFQSKLNRASRQATKNQIDDMKRLVNSQMSSIDNLKQMSDYYIPYLSNGYTAKSFE